MTYSKSPTELAREDKIRGYKIIGVFVGIFVLAGIGQSVWQSRQNDKTVREFLSAHTDCHYPDTTLLQYISAYNKQVDATNLSIACADLANGTHSFQLASATPTPTKQAPESAETYEPISVVSSAVEHSTVLEDYCVATFKWEGTQYTV